MVIDSPLVSVIIPTYDRPELLRRALTSVVSQSYENLEIIVVDDCPSEPAKKVVERFDDSRIRYILHEQNKGVCGARNTGIKRSQGQLLAFLDDDDTWLKHKIQEQINLASNNTNTNLVYTGSKNVDDSGNTLSVSRPGIEGDVTKRLLLGDFISFSSILVDRETIEQASLLDEDLTNWEDWEWCIRLSRHTDVGFINQTLVVSYRGKHEMRSDDFEKKRDIGFDRFINKVRPIAGQYGSLFKRKFRSYLHYHLGYDALGSDYSEARKRLFTSIKLWPFISKSYVYLSLAILGHPGYTTAQSVKRRVVDLLD